MKKYFEKNKAMFLFILGLIFINLGREHNQLLFIVGIILAIAGNIVLTTMYFEPTNKIWWIKSMKYISHSISILLVFYLIFQIF